MVGEALDITGLCVCAYYSDGTSKDVTNECEISGFDSSMAFESQTIYVSFSDNKTTKTCSFTIKINQQTNKVLSKIEVTTQPSKKEYFVNEEFDKTGLVITATYSDESTNIVTEFCEFSGFNSFEINDNLRIGVTYTENGVSKITSFTVKIKAAPGVAKYEKSLWGKWTRIDNGEIYTITAYDISKNKWSEETFDSVQMESDNVLLLKSGSEKYRLFRQAGATTTFTAKVAGFTTSTAGRAAGAEGTEQNVLSGVTVKRQSEDIESDTDEATTDANGVVEFTDVVAGETQILTVEKADGTEVTVGVTPQFDGDNCGTITIVESGYSIKTTHKICRVCLNAKTNDYFYGNNFETYNLTLNFINIGDDTCDTATWELFCNDSQLNLSQKSGMLSSVAAGNFKTVSLDVSYGTLNEYYKDVDVIVKLTDSKLKKVWLDQITLRFYQLPVQIDVQSYSVDGSGHLNGFVVCPDGKAMYFNSYDNEDVLLMPYKVGATGNENKYTVVFSTTSDTDEMAYGLSAGYYARPLNYYDFDDFFKNASTTDRFNFVDSYEDGNGNNTEDNAIIISDPFIQTRSYVQYGDIDYFTFDVTKCMLARIDSITIPKAGVSAAGKTVSATIKGSNLKSPLENVSVNCGSKSIVNKLNKNTYTDSIMYVDLVIPANAGDFTVTASSEEYSKEAVFNVKNYSVETGDVVLKDGTVVSPNIHEEREEFDSFWDEVNDKFYNNYDDETNKYYNIIEVNDLTEQQISDAVGIICINHAGVPFILGKYNTYENEGRIVWSKEGTTGYNTDFTDITCHMIKNGEEINYSEYYSVEDTYFAGDTNGSDNWEYISSIDPEVTANAATNYPAFNWVNNYAATYALTGTDMEEGWYIPSIAELCTLYDNRETLNTTLNVLNGSILYSTICWSSSQSHHEGCCCVWPVSLYNGCYCSYFHSNDSSFYVCCIRAFE